MDDTIFAPATAAGKAGIAVIRISGPRAVAVARAMTGRDTLPPRRACRVRFTAPDRDATPGVVIDDGLVICFPGPASFTGEDLAEFHCHGGPAILEALLGTLATQPGLRPAEPGEFTRRAFLAGKLDLSQAEGIADLIEAESPAQLAQARRQADGALSRIYEAWRAECLDLLATIAADIDFADEGIDHHLPEHARAKCCELRVRLEAELNDAGAALRVKQGYVIGVLGPPNAGKSSLINALAKRDAAIVSARPGTTRDILEIRLRLGNHDIILADSAGLREVDDEIEAEGIRRARRLVADADLRLWACPASERGAPVPAGWRPGDFRLWTKSDLEATRHGADDHSSPDHFLISAKTGAGLPDLLEALARHVDGALGRRPHPGLTNARQIAAVREASDALTRAIAQLPDHVELAAEELLAAANALGRIAGRIDVEEVLGAVFARFCIGK